MRGAMEFDSDPMQCSVRYVSSAVLPHYKAMTDDVVRFKQLGLM